MANGVTGSKTARIARSLVVANGKGGVGKTTITANLAYEASKRWNRVIAVDLDPQANLGADLGVEVHDAGESFAKAALGLAESPNLYETGRDGLFYIAGGEELNSLERSITSHNELPSAVVGIRRALREHLDRRTWLMIDTPPATGNMLSDAALALGQWLLIPTKEDARSRAGVATVLDRVINVGETMGSTIRPVGAVLFGLDSRATRINARTRADLEAGIGGAFPVLESTIREAKKAQIDAKEVGVTATEYSDMADAADLLPWYEAASKGISQLTFATNADTLAGDYQRLAHEVAQIMTRSKK